MRTLACFALVFVAACSGGDSSVKIATADGARPPDDMAITTTRGAMMLTVRADSMRMRISDAARATIDSAMTKNDTGTGFGAWVKRKAMGAARKGLSMEISVPLSNVQDARVVNGALVFTYKPGTRDPFQNVKADKSPLLESFKSEDAEQFAAFVRGRIGAGAPVAPPAKASAPAQSPAPTKF
jgi:hypothetical protein